MLFTLDFSRKLVAALGSLAITASYLISEAGISTSLIA